MTKKAKYIKFGSIILIIIVLLSFVMIGCGDYMKFTLRDAVANCSFEYPSSYAKPYVDRTMANGNVVTAFLYSREKDATPDVILTVTVWKVTSDFFPNSRALLESNLESVQRGQNTGEFKLVERSPITVAGIQGEQIIYYYARIPDTYHTGKIERTPAIAYEAYFENNGILWSIEVHAIVNISDQAKTDFGHIINSFKFLD